MPYKYPKDKGWKIPKQKYKLKNWSKYNNALKDRGRIDFWLDKEAIDNWYEEDQENIGTGAPRQYTDFCIIICHEIRQVYRLPLRQSEGFINSIFRMMGLNIKCPNYSVLSKRLLTLNIPCPRYTEKDTPDDDVAAMTIDSTGLKRFGRDEWHQEKHKVSAKRSWRKLHVCVDDKHYIHGSVLTDRFASDEGTIDDLIEQVTTSANHVSLDSAYDSNDVYVSLKNKFPNAKIVIPPDKNAIIHDKNHAIRNQHLQEIQAHGRMNWQKENQYGRRNISELSIQRRKRILGNQLHAREFTRQKVEAMIGSGILNKMTSLGMPQSYRCA
jgi:Transposase DDE domain